MGDRRAALIDVLNRIRGPFNVTGERSESRSRCAGRSRISSSAAACTMRTSGRRFVEAIAALGNHGLVAVPSEANFVLVRFEGEVSAETALARHCRGGLCRAPPAGPRPARRAAHHHREKRRHGARDGRTSRAVRRDGMTIHKVAIIGLGLLGGSIGLALRERAPGVETAGFDANPNVRDVAGERGLVGTVCDIACRCGPRCRSGGPVRAGRRDGGSRCEHSPKRCPKARSSAMSVRPRSRDRSAVESLARPHHHPRPPGRRDRTERAGSGICHAVRQSLVHPHPARRCGRGRGRGAVELLGRRSAPRSRSWTRSITTWCWR